MKISTRFALATAIGSALLVTSTSQAALELVTKNTTAPGIAGASWATSSPFSNPSIDNSGNVAFRASLLVGGDVTSSNNTTGWYGSPSSLTLFARTGNPAPGLSGVNLTAFSVSNIGLSPNGTLQFAGATPAPNGYVAIGSASGGFTKVARNGDVLPGVGGVAINSSPAGLQYHFVNDAGQTLVYATLTGNTSNGLWVGNGADLRLAYQTGQSYAGLPTGGTPKGINAAMINGSGSLFSTYLLNDAAGIDTNNNEIMTTLAFGSTTFTPVAREGEVAPDAGGATYKRGLFNVGLGIEDTVFVSGNGNYNNLGHAIYSTGLEGTGVTTANNAALFYYDGASTNLLRRRGDSTTAVPNATLGFNMGVGLAARLNNNDNVAWTTALTTGVGDVTSSNDGVLLHTELGSSSDTLVAREGSTVPVVPGALFGSSFSNLLQNNQDQLIFSTTLLDDPNDANNNVTTTNDLALLGWNPISGYSLIAREGDDLSSIGINMMLTGSWLGINNNASTEGGAYALTDNGWLTFRVSGTALPGFTDNAAIVRMQIPEPTSIGLIGASGLMALRRRRKI